MLDINTNDKVLILPKVTLNDIYDNMSPIENVQEGSIVYNTKVNVSDVSTENLIKGIYSWNGEKWVLFGEMEKLTLYKNITSTERQNVLGYDPSSNYADIGGRENPNRSCLKWDTEGGNGHYYCLIREELSWVDAFETAKETSGYLATINSQAEFQFLDRSFNLSTLSSTKYSNTSEYNKIGIGWRFVQYSTTKEILKKMKWITGEENLVDWNNTLNQMLGNQFNIQVGSSTSTTNDKGKKDGCGVISNNKFTTTTCNPTSGNSKKVQYYIIEYNG